MTAQPYEMSPRVEEGKGYLQFEVGRKMASQVLGQALTRTGYDMMHRQQGGFFVTVPHPVSYIHDGDKSYRKSGQKTIAERRREVRVSSLQEWPRAIGPRAVKLAVLHQSVADGQLLENVALAVVPDDDSYESIARMAEVKLAPDETYRRLDLLPRIILPVRFLRHGDESVEPFSSDAAEMISRRLASLQEVVRDNDAMLTRDDYHLQVPARFYTPKTPGSR